MGLSPQLAVALLCLLACTGSPTHRRREDRRLEEIVNSLDQVTKKGVSYPIWHHLSRDPGDIAGGSRLSWLSY